MAEITWQTARIILAPHVQTQQAQGAGTCGCAKLENRKSARLKGHSTKGPDAPFAHPDTHSKEYPPCKATPKSSATCKPNSKTS